MRRTTSEGMRSLFDAQREGREAANSPAMSLLARAGYVTKGVVYLIVGGLSARVALGDGGSTTDRNGALRAIHEQPFGRFLLVVVAVGLIAFALWSMIQALLDPEREGTGTSGIIARLGYAAVGVSYAALGLAAIQLVLGSGNGGASSDTTTHDWTARLLGLPFGPVLVIVVGIIVIGVAGYLLYLAYAADFRDRLTLNDVDNRVRAWVIALGRAGYAALGVVFSIVGIFLIVAALRDNAEQSKSLGGALHELAREPYGHVVLGAVALGLIAYGLYSLTEARYRRLGSTRST